MTPEQKQQKLREWLPEIAKACGLKNAEWVERRGFEPTCFYWSGGTHHKFEPQDNDHDSAYMRRVMEVNVRWEQFEIDGETYCRVEASTFNEDAVEFCVGISHDGTPDSMGAAERWAAIQAAAKKLGLE